MKNLVYATQCMAIVACLAFASFIGCSANGNQISTTPHNTDSVAKIKPISDTDSLQLDVCKRLLSECVAANILDAYGLYVYYGIVKNPSVAKYMELIEECEREENFYDTVGSGDTWLEYCQYVLEPRGMLN